MSQLELLKHVLGILERLQIPVMLVGSHASSFYGEARTTHDIDLLVGLDRHRIPELIAAFNPNRHYVSERALYEGRLANVIDLQTGDKVDLFLSQGTPRDVSAMRRRRIVEWLGLDLPMISPEDLILAKLRWAEMQGGSERQSQDIAGVLKRQRHELDVDYLRRELIAEGLDHRWQEIVSHL